MITLPIDFTIVGFPKCGTSALLRELGKCNGIHIGRIGDQIEIDLTSLTEAQIPAGFFAKNRLNGHKYSSYIFSRNRMQALAKMSEHGRYILCVRNPLLSLISWHRMHVNIANSPPSNHFAWIQRDFYAGCTLDGYYDRFARPRLQYDWYLNDLLDIVPVERTLVVWQSKMAESTQDVVRECVEFLGMSTLESKVSAPYIAFADRSETEVSDAIRVELSHTVHELKKLIRTSGVREIA